MREQPAALASQYHPRQSGVELHFQPDIFSPLLNCCFYQMD